MSWEREPLFSKSKLFFEKAFNEDKESPFFGLWCAMGLELLCRSALAKVSPTLLAEPDRDHQNLLHALGLGSSKVQRKSIGTAQVISLCQTLIPEFTDGELKATLALINRRNEELHSGGVAFGEYPTQHWISSFYKCCKILCEHQGESLNSLFGIEVEKEAALILSEEEVEVVNQIKTLIAAHKKVFESKDQEERDTLRDSAQKHADRSATRGYHRVVCPACGCTGTIIGEPFGKDNIQHEDLDIIVKQSILPTRYHCSACGLKLTGFNALKVSGIGNHYTRKTTYSPEEYYNLINPNDYGAIAERYSELGVFFEDHEEWNND